MIELSIGERILGRYRVVKQLAHGGMGVVYLGRTEGAEGFSRPVVIKRLLNDIASNRRHNEMFIREARILSNLQHPNIVGVLDFGREKQSYVMVLEYVHGYDLGQWASFARNTGRHIEVDHAIYIVRKVLDALHYAHQLKRHDGQAANIVHRDVSPSNVLLDEQAQVKLHDFGIARMEGVGDGLTEGDTFKGKLAYAAPELLTGAGAASPRSDLYAAAVTLYQLLAGTNPFRSTNASESVHRVLNQMPTPLAAVREDAPPQLDEILHKALAKRAEDRYATAAEFGQALAAVEREADECVVAELAAVLARDFVAMPAELELQSLEERDNAWRLGQTGPQGRHSRLTSSVPCARNSQPTVIQAHVGGDETQAEATSKQPIELGHRPPAASPGAKGRSPIMIAAITIGVFFIGATLAFVGRKREDTSPRYLVIEKPSSGAAPTMPAPSIDEASSEPRSNSALIPPEVPPTSLPSASAVEMAPVQSAPAATSPPKPALGKPAATPSSDALSRMFRKRGPQIESCVNRHSVENEELPRISVRFEVLASGAVSRAELSPSSVASTPLGACVLGVARSVHFGSLGEPVAFSIPITLRRAP